MNLRLKFNLILLAVMALGLVCSGVAFYYISRERSKDQLDAQIRVLRSQALAIRKYTSDEIRPLLASFGDIQFLPQSIPSFSAHSVFNIFSEQMPNFYYKEAVLNPTNPSHLAVSWEREIIQKLRDDRSQKQIVQTRESSGSQLYTVAYPLVIDSEGCLTCHSTPERAPKSMVALYGSKAGFGWNLNEVVGAQIFSVPIESTEREIWRNLWNMLGAMAAVFALLVVALNLLLTRLIITPVVEMSKIAEKVSLGDRDVPEFAQSGSDEIASLGRSFNRMRRSLDNAMKMLSP